MKYIFVTGGVVSSLGKGITAASLGRLLKNRGLKVIMQKIDPYLNIDPGTMSPYQHGEVFVTDDGAETDLDLGHYERFTNINLTKSSNITTGKVYWSVINKERKGEYQGDTVQVIPHITNEIKSRIYKVGKESNPDVVIIEIGGTVGDIESLPFLEAIRQIKYEVGQENVLFIHVTLVPYLRKAGELKTKPTQHSVKELRSIGIQPDIIVCRTEKPLSREMKDKIGLFCNVDGDSVFQNTDAKTLYQVPLTLNKEGLDSMVIKKLSIESKNEPDLEEWTQIVNKILHPSKKTKIAIVGKYIELHDAYLSIAESLCHAGIANDAEVEIKWINSDELDKNNLEKELKDTDGILVPGSFNKDDIESKILVAKYARENKTPYLGINLGMQISIIEYARNVLKLEGANSTEIDKNTPHPIIHKISEQEDIENPRKASKLGLHPCKIIKGTKAYEVYKSELIFERYRHKSQFNNQYRESFMDGDIIISGLSPDQRLIEIIELKNHPCYIACLYHPEYKSRPNNPHPLFKEFIKSALTAKN